MLLDQTARHGLDVWNAYGRCFKGMLLTTRGDVAAGLRLLGAAVDELREAKFVQYHTTFLGWLAEGFAAAGQAVQGLTAINDAPTRSEVTEERWAMAEFLRIKGELLLLQDEPKAAVAAEEHFRKALDWGSTAVSPRGSEPPISSPQRLFSTRFASRGYRRLPYFLAQRGSALWSSAIF